MINFDKLETKCEVLLNKIAPLKESIIISYFKEYDNSEA